MLIGVMDLVTSEVLGVTVTKMLVLELEVHVKCLVIDVKGLSY